MVLHVMTAPFVDFLVGDNHPPLAIRAIRFRVVGRAAEAPFFLAGRCPSSGVITPPSPHRVPLNVDALRVSADINF